MRLTGILFFVVEDSEGSRLMSKVGPELVKRGILVGCDPETLVLRLMAIAPSSIYFQVSIF